MNWSPLLQTLLLLIIIIDRIEPPYAIVEWENMALSSIHRSLLPPNVKEGQLLELTIQRHPQGRSYMLRNDPALFQMPHKQILIPAALPLARGKQYHIEFHIPHRSSQ